MDRTGHDDSLLEIIDPSVESRLYIKDAFSFPEWATGHISHTDARFLYDMIRDAAPREIAEIGVASGVSSAFMLRVIADLGLGARLSAFDISDAYYADPSKRVGQYVYDVHGDAPPDFELFPNISSMQLADKMAELKREPFDLVFIDANHNHPWPGLDLLAILPAVRPGSWVLLHDVNLPSIHPQFPSHGPNYLFYGWPGQRRIFKDIPRNETKTVAMQANIGAIRLFDTIAENVRATLGTLDNPWDEMVRPEEYQRVQPIVAQAGALAPRQLKAIYRKRVPMAERYTHAKITFKKYLKNKL